MEEQIPQEKEKELTPMQEEDWLNLITGKIKSSRYGYYMSWWLRLDTGIKSSTINYHLGKLVKKGLLESKSNCYGTEYKLPL